MTDVETSPQPDNTTQTDREGVDLRNFGANIERRFYERQWGNLFTLSECAELDQSIKKANREQAEALASGEGFAHASSQGLLKRFEITQQTCGFFAKDFFQLVAETDQMGGGNFRFNSGQQLADFQEFLVAELARGSNPFITSGQEWRSWKNPKRHFIFRAIALSEALYTTLNLAAIAVKAPDLFPEAQEVASLNLARQLLRGKQKAQGTTAKTLQGLGVNYQEARPLPPNAYTSLINKLVLGKIGSGG